jgi:hypothetical protein
MVNKNPYVMDDITEDFGFSFSDEEEVLAPVADEVTDLKSRLEAIRKIYLPMLEKLSKDSDKAIIKWPNRGPILKRQIDKLLELTEPGFKNLRSNRSEATIDSAKKSS